MPIRLIKELYHIKDTKVDEVVEPITQTINTLESSEIELLKLLSDTLTDN